MEARLAGRASPVAVASVMAKVNLRLRGGPLDKQTVTLDVDDANNPPDPYHVKLHGPHEATEPCEYRRVSREPEGRADAGTWIYEVHRAEGR